MRAARRSRPTISSLTNLPSAQKLPRHAKLNTTPVYVEVTNERRVEAIDRLDPFSQ